MPADYTSASPSRAAPQPALVKFNNFPHLTLGCKHMTSIADNEPVSCSCEIRNRLSEHTHFSEKDRSNCLEQLRTLKITEHFELASTTASTPRDTYLSNKDSEL